MYDTFKRKVREAYAKCGMKPTAHYYRWQSAVGDDLCCPASALAVASGKVDASDLNSSNSSGYGATPCFDRLQSALRFHPGWLYGFMAAVDHRGSHGCYGPMLAGYRVGVEVRKDLFGE